MKLTPYKIKVLVRLADGELLHTCSHPRSPQPWSAFWHASTDTVRIDVVYALAQAGLIENFEDPGWRWRGGKYRITEAGRAALRSKEEGQSHE